MHVRPNRTRFAVLSVAGALALVGVACGDDGGSDSSSATTTAAAAAPTTTAAPAASTTAAPTTTAPAAAAGTIVDVATKAGSFTVLVEAVKAAGLVDTLKGPGPFTVFAPTDAAFTAALTQLGTTKEKLLSDTATLAAVLKYHVVAGKVTAADVAKLNGQEVASVGGPKLKVTVAGSEVKINDAKVAQADVAASNGVIHVIDKVLLPPSA